MVLPPAGLAVRPVCESPNKEIANADPHDRETHGMSAHGTWRLSLRCAKFRRDRRYADIDLPPTSIASETYDPKQASTAAARFFSCRRTWPDRRV
jgi:hypothetical protein